MPDESLLDAVARDAGLEQGAGHIRVAGARDDLGCADAAVGELEVRLRAEPFHAPEADELSALRLGARELAAAERAGRVLRLRDGVVLLPTAPALAMRALARLEQPFTTSQARQALCTTRRVAIPLLEHLDARGWTRRLDAGHREVVR
jgi:selenocysteine-specific elongation factor